MYGTFDKFDNVPPLYAGDVEEFKEQVNNNDLETIIIIPGLDKTVRFLHNLTLHENKNLHLLHN